MRSIGFVGVSTFLIVNVASLKLIVGVTPVVNLLATALLISVALYRILTRRKIKKNIIGWLVFLGIIIFIIPSSLPEYLFIREVNTGHANTTLRVLYTLICVFFIVSSAERRDVYTFVQCQFVWGLILSIGHIFGVVDYSFYGDLHYKTLSMPIALSTLVIIAYLIEEDNIRNISLFFQILFLSLNLIAIISLLSRSPFLFITAIVILFNLLKNEGLIGNFYNLIKYTLYTAIFIFSGWVFLIYKEISINIPALERIYNIYSGGGVRIDMWGKCVEVISEHPFGLGWGGFSDVSGYIYPHNILLEAGVVSGLVGFLVIFVVLLLYTLWVFLKYNKMNVLQKTTFVQMSYVSFYIILTFLVSYSFDFSYMLFLPISLSSSFFMKDIR
jgi:O-antigen ligase